MKIKLSREYRAYAILLVWVLIFSWILVRHFGFVDYESIRSFVRSASVWSLPSIIFFVSSILFLRSLLYYGKSFFFGDTVDSNDKAASHQLVTNALFSYGVAETSGFRQYMEDRFVVAGDVGKIPGVSVYGVFDGHGGHRASEYAAQNLVKYLAENPQELLHDPARLLFKSFLKTDAAFVRKGMAQDPPYDDGTTAIVALVLPWDGEPRSTSTSSTGSRRSSTAASCVKDTKTKASLTTTTHSAQGLGSRTPDSPGTTPDTRYNSTTSTKLSDSGTSGAPTPSPVPGESQIPGQNVSTSSHTRVGGDHTSSTAPLAAPSGSDTRKNNNNHHSDYRGDDEEEEEDISPDGASCMRISPRSVIVDSFRIMVANAGDSKAILVRANGAVEHLSFDHKPNRPDEVTRIRNLGGVVCFNGVWRVQGVLAVSRSLGDRLLKPYVTCRPDIRTWVLRSPKNSLLRQNIRAKAETPRSTKSVDTDSVIATSGSITSSTTASAVSVLSTDDTSSKAQSTTTRDGKNSGNTLTDSVDSIVAQDTPPRKRSNRESVPGNAEAHITPPTTPTVTSKADPTMGVSTSGTLSTPSKPMSDAPWHVEPMNHSPLVLVLATDGLWDVISAEEVAEFVYNACMQPEKACSRFSGCMSSSRSSRQNRRNSSTTMHISKDNDDDDDDDDDDQDTHPSSSSFSSQHSTNDGSLRHGHPSHSKSRTMSAAEIPRKQQRSIYTPLRPACSSTWRTESGALMQEVSTKLMHRALELGSKDNITVLCVDLRAPARVVPAHADRFITKTYYSSLKKKNMAPHK